MSEARRNRRKARVHMNHLANLLGRFYEFLESSPKPTDAQVRAVFLESNKWWCSYCESKNLSKTASFEFTRQVAETWKHKEQEHH